MPFHTFLRHTLIHKQLWYSLLEHFQTSYPTNWEKSSIAHRLAPPCKRLEGSDESWAQVHSLKKDRSISQGLINLARWGTMGLLNCLEDTYRLAIHLVNYFMARIVIYKSSLSISHYGQWRYLIWMIVLQRLKETKNYRSKRSRGSMNTKANDYIRER